MPYFSKIWIIIKQKLLFAIYLDLGDFNLDFQIKYQLNKNSSCLWQKKFLLLLLLTTVSNSMFWLYKSQNIEISQLSQFQWHISIGRRHTRCPILMNWILLIIHDLRIYLRKYLCYYFTPTLFLFISHSKCFSFDAFWRKCQDVDMINNSREDQNFA